jgi:hypothetical protein
VVFSSGGGSRGTTAVNGRCGQVSGACRSHFVGYSLSVTGGRGFIFTIFCRSPAVSFFLFLLKGKISRKPMAFGAAYGLL